MTTLEQIQQEIQTLPEATLDLLAQFIQLLKKSQAATQSHLSTPEPSPGPDATDWSDFIGSINAEDNPDNTPLPSLIGSAPGSFATPAAADQFLRQERDSWDS